MDFQIISGAEASVETLVKSINRVVINPVIFFMFAVAMVYFLFGVAQYLMYADNEEIRKKSKSHMIWGIVGLFIMVAVFGIMRLILNTVGENRVKINDAGNYVVDGSNLSNTSKNALDLGVGVSTDVNAPDLPQATFVTNPFATYSSNNSCWHKVLYGKASTEYNALETAKGAARKQYLSDNGVSATDQTKVKYPTIFETKILYDKSTKQYYAWIDVRAPKGTGTMSNCKLDVLAPAPYIPESAIANAYDLSSGIDTPELPLSTFTTNPFATFKQNTLCWQRPINSKAVTEYKALNDVKNLARQQYISDNGVSITDKTKINYPIIFGTKVLYNKTDKMYYAWLDARAPISTGTTADCKLDILTPAPIIPASVFTLGETDLSTTIVDSTILSYTTSPFTKTYIPSTLCWRKEVMGVGATEYQALQQVKSKARNAYISENNLSAGDVKENLPTTYGVFTAFDKITKNYYAWWDARGPINGGEDKDCNIDEVPRPVNQSTKPNPLLGSYFSDGAYYRVVESGVDTTYVGARSMAIKNALTQIALIKGLTNTSTIKYTILPEEKYYPPVPATATTPAYKYYDYWLVIESPR